MKTVIRCPFCKKKIPISRKIACGEEVIDNIICPHCQRKFSIEIDALNNPYLLGYFEDEMKHESAYSKHGIRYKWETPESLIKGEEYKKRLAYAIRYDEESIETVIDTSFRDEINHIRCAQCGKEILFNRMMKLADVHGLFCDACARYNKTRFLSEFLCKLYDTENETIKKESKQEEKNMKIRCTIIGFVVESGEKYNIYNPENNQLSVVSKADFESMCLGEFPYRKVRANTLHNNEVVRTVDGRILYVSDASRNKMLDFETGRIEESAVMTNLMANVNCYTKYVPVIKKYCKLSDVVAGTIDPRIAKMVEVIANDISTGEDDESTNSSSVVAKMVRFLMDPDYDDLLDKEILNDIVMNDAQAFMVMSQMTTMQMNRSIMSGFGAIPISVQNNNTEVNVPGVEKRVDESDTQYKQRLTRCMNEAAERNDYVTAGMYQRALTFNK